MFSFTMHFRRRYKAARKWYGKNIKRQIFLSVISESLNLCLQKQGKLDTDASVDSCGDDQVQVHLLSLPIFTYMP